MKKRIIISVTNDLNTDQRVQKVAASCTKNGYDVLLVGRHLSSSTQPPFTFQFKRFKLLFNRSALFYAEFNVRLFFFLLFVKGDIFLANDTDTLLANFFAARLRRKKLIFDAHELFPEVPELADKRIRKWIWTSIEKNIFPYLKNSYTVCKSIADYYHQKYGISMQVVRNVPLYKFNQVNSTPHHPERIILYQGALNKGRGLEWILDAMPYIDNAKLLIVGDGDIAQELKLRCKNLSLESKVEFYGKRSVQELHEITPKASIGLCLLENIGLSYYYSLPNRVFDYIQAGVPILASNFPEIENTVNTYKTGMLINQYEPEFLAGIIHQMLEHPYPTDHFKNVAKELCWENEEKILLSIIEAAQ